jgi:hypothetical protein
MQAKTQPFIPAVVVAATIIASVGLFAASLFYPAFNLSDGSSYGGMSTLLLGWMGVLALGGTEGLGKVGLLAWYANLFLVPVWLGLALRRFRFAPIGGLILSILSTGLASSAIFVKRILVDEAGNSAAVTAMGPAFYVWLSSFVVCLAGYLGGCSHRSSEESLWSPRGSLQHHTPRFRFSAATCR